MPGFGKAKRLAVFPAPGELTTRSMTCAICGNTLPCAHSRRNTAVLLEETGNSASARAAGLAAPNLHKSSDPQHWRREVISRVQQHRARRRKRFDPNALELDFPAPDSFADRGSTAWDEPDGGPAAADESLFIGPDETLPGDHQESARPGPPKIIHFPVPPFARIPAAEPRFTAGEEEGGVEPQPDAPRIIDADAGSYDAGPYRPMDDMDYVAPAPVAPPAEQMELLPSFDDIQLDEPGPRLEEKPELIPQPAPLGQRMVAGTVDLGIVLIACLMFNMIFTRLAEASPHSRTATLCAMAVGGALWMLYQYLFLAHGEGTPGMRLTQLELATFDGGPVGRKQRRLRALASGLSGFSLGLGYGWALVDEDQLGWHDRMTGTLMKSSSQPPAISTQP